MSYWKDKDESIIFIYTTENYEGDLTLTSEEGELEWIDFDELKVIPQFDQNKKFTPYLFKDELFEGKFLLNSKCEVLDFSIRNM